MSCAGARKEPAGGFWLFGWGLVFGVFFWLWLGWGLGVEMVFGVWGFFGVWGAMKGGGGGGGVGGVGGGGGGIVLFGGVLFFFGGVVVRESNLMKMNRPRKTVRSRGERDGHTES